MGMKLLFDEQARKAWAGVNALADAVKALGPKGRNGAGKKCGSPTITNDGVSIAKEIELPDPFENLGRSGEKVATKTNDVAGDGTTTATVAQALVPRAKNAAGAEPLALKGASTRPSPRWWRN